MAAGGTGRWTSTSPGAQPSWRCSTACCEGRPRERGQLAVILGPGWIGKTALIRQFLDDREARVRWVCADRDETGLPGGLLGSSGSRRRATASIRYGRARRCSRSCASGQGHQRPRASEASGVPGAVLVVDDAQWGDPLSLQALSYALRRLPDTPLRSPGTARSAPKLRKLS